MCGGKWAMTGGLTASSPIVTCSIPSCVITTSRAYPGAGSSRKSFLRPRRSRRSRSEGSSSGLARPSRVGQRGVDRVDKRPQLRRLRFDIDPDRELAQRRAAYRPDRLDQRPAETLLKRCFFADALRDGEKIAGLRRAGESHLVDLIPAKGVD